MKIALTVLVLMVSGAVSLAGEAPDEGSKYLAFSASYLEVKDQYNHGFVFSGPDVKFEYGVRKINSRRFLQWSVSLAGGGKTALGSWGFCWAVSPFQITRSFNIYSSEKTDLYCGPDFSINYNLQNYPDMHSGHLSWMTSYSLGLHLLAVTEFSGKKLIIQNRTSLLSATSRPEAERDQHYYSLNAGDIFSDMHSNLTFQAANDFFRSDFSFELMLSEQSSLTYCFEYQSYLQEMEFKQLNHALTYTYYFDRMGW